MRLFKVQNVGKSPPSLEMGLSFWIVVSSKSGVLDMSASESTRGLQSSDTAADLRGWWILLGSSHVVVELLLVVLQASTQAIMAHVQSSRVNFGMGRHCYWVGGLL